MAQFLAYISAIAGVFLFLAFYHGLFPHLAVRLQVEEVSAGGLLRIRLQVENKSDVFARKASAQLQVREHAVPPAMQQKPRPQVEKNDATTLS
jgi:hypothetical protein